MSSAAAVELLPPQPTKLLRPFASSAAHAERVALGATAAAVALLPLAHPSGPANIAPEDALVAASVVLCLLWIGTAGARWRFPYALPVAIFTVGGVVGALIGPVPENGVVAVVQDMVLLVWCWTVANVARSPQNLRVLLRTWAYASVGWAIMPLLGFALHTDALTGRTPNQGSRIQITLADPSYAANYFFISIMIIWATQCPRRRPARLLAYALLVTGIALTGSNSGALSLVVGTTAAALIAVYRRFGGPAAAAALALIVLSGAFVAANVSLSSLQGRASVSRYAFIRDGFGRGTSVEQRGMLLHESLRLFRAGNPLGEGPVSTKTRLRDELAPFEKEAHDDYMAALMERGAIGLFGLLLLVGALMARGGAVALEGVSARFAAAVARPNALLGAVLGTLVAGSVYELLHVRHIWALFGFVAAAYTWGRR